MSERFVTFRINVNQNDEPFEIAAIKIEDCQIIDRFSTFVSVSMDDDISEFHGVYAEQLENAPSVDEAISRFGDFISDSTLIPFFYQNHRLLKKYLPNYCHCKTIEYKTLMATYEDAIGISDDDFRKNWFDCWENMTIFLNCWKIRNDALGDAIVIAKLFIWTEIQKEMPY